MNAHNEQHDPASAVVKQNLTTQPAAAQEAVAWVPPSFFDKGVVAATARRKPPSETAVAMRGEYVPLYAAPVTAAPADHLHAHLLHMLGAKDHEDAGRIIGELHAAAMRTPAAPGIDLTPLWRLSDTWLKALGVRGLGDEEKRLRWAMAKELRDALSLLDASPKGDDCATCNGRGMIGGLLPAGGGYESEPCPDCSPKGAMQAGDAEVQP